ncbi:MAG: hypothetical protein EOO38_04365 [Cytophagaceae bacterium]|jgi:hypothetical protein|nr:MAG: hypothetical protein EOO38_04365 [Cytophagaceae bacterium]
MDQDKRTRQRLTVNNDVFVRDRSDGELLGKIANIHLEGFMLIGSRALREDALFPVLLEAEGLTVSANAECLWTSETGSGDQIWAGFGFLDLDAEEERKLGELVRRFET